MSADDPTQIPEWQRPISEQVAVIRHDLAGVRTRFELAGGLLERLTMRVEHMEQRQTVMQEQLAKIVLTPEGIYELVTAAIQKADAEKADKEAQLAAERVKAEEERDERRWKKMSRLIVVVTTVFAIVPNIERIVGWFT